MEHKSLPMFKRIRAYIVDSVILFLPTLIIVYSTYHTKIHNYAAFAAILLSLGYFISFTYYNKGKTFGKLSIGGKLVSLKGGLTFVQILTRYLVLQAVAVLPYGVEFLLLKSSGVAFDRSAHWGSLITLAVFIAYVYFMYKDPKHQGLHDKLANTMVVEG